MQKILTIIESNTPPISANGGLWVKDLTLLIQSKGEWKEIKGGSDIELAQEQGYDPTKAISQKGFTDALNSSQKYFTDNYTPNMQDVEVLADTSGFATVDLISKTGFYQITGNCKRLTIKGGTAPDFKKNVSIITGKWDPVINSDPFYIEGGIIRMFDTTLPIPGEYFEITIFNNFAKLTNTKGYK